MADKDFEDRMAGTGIVNAASEETADRAIAAHEADLLRQRIELAKAELPE